MSANELPTIVSVSGIEAHLFGDLQKLKDESITQVIIFISHGRLGKVEDVYRYCQDLLQTHTYFAQLNTNNLPNLLAVAVEQRNHGKRLVDPSCNEGWVSKNNPDYRDHPLDMYSIQIGTSRDISTLIDFLPIKLKIKSKKVLFGITGISLGGHVSLLCMGLDERIAVSASIIGCGDFLTLMKNRAVQNKSKFEDYFPDELVKVVEKNDPIHHIQSFKDKPLILISGGADKLVPANCSNEFMGKLKESYTDQDKLVWSIHKKAKHEVLPEMWKDARDFLFKWLYFDGKLPIEAPSYPVHNANL